LLGRGFLAISWSSVSLVSMGAAGACFANRHETHRPGFPPAPRGGPPPRSPSLEERLDDHQSPPERGPKARSPSIGTCSCRIAMCSASPAHFDRRPRQRSQKAPPGLWNLHATLTISQPNTRLIFEEVSRQDSSVAPLRATWAVIFIWLQRRLLSRCTALPIHRLAGRSLHVQAQCAGVWPIFGPRDFSTPMWARFPRIQITQAIVSIVWRALGFHQ